MTLPDMYVPAGSSGHGNFTVDIDPQRAGWTFSGLRVLVLEAGASEVVETGEAELLVLPLAGGATVDVDGETFELEGRRGVFSGVTDYLYVGRGKTLDDHLRSRRSFCLPLRSRRSRHPRRLLSQEPGSRGFARRRRLLAPG